MPLWRRQARLPRRGVGGDTWPPPIAPRGVPAPDAKRAIRRVRREHDVFIVTVGRRVYPPVGPTRRSGLGGAPYEAPPRREALANRHMRRARDVVTPGRRGPSAIITCTAPASQFPTPHVRGVVGRTSAAPRRPPDRLRASAHATIRDTSCCCVPIVRSSPSRPAHVHSTSPPCARGRAQGIIMHDTQGNHDNCWLRKNLDLDACETGDQVARSPLRFTALWPPICWPAIGPYATLGTTIPLAANSWSSTATACRLRLAGLVPAAYSPLAAYCPLVVGPVVLAAFYCRLMAERILLVA